MPYQSEIRIFNIARTEVDPSEVSDWLSSLNVSEEAITELLSTFLTTSVSDPALLVALAAKRCYMSFEPGLNPNVTRVRKNYTDFFDNIIQSRHGSVMEHAVFSYAIEGVSRVFTAEMNRHRAGWAISEGSLRFIRFNNIQYYLPPFLTTQASDSVEMAEKKRKTREAFNDIFSYIESQYVELSNLWNLDNPEMPFSQKKIITSALRRIIPMGVATGGVWTGNVRALRHVIAMRTDPSAEEEISYVFSLVAEDMIKRVPMLMDKYLEYRKI